MIKVSAWSLPRLLIKKGPVWPYLVYLDVYYSRMSFGFSTLRQRNNACCQNISFHLIHRRTRPFYIQGRWLSQYVKFMVLIEYNQNGDPINRKQVANLLTGLRKAIKRSNAHEIWRKGSSFISKMIQDTEPWFQWLLCMMRLGIRWTLPLFSLFGRIWLSSIRHHDKTLHCEPVSQ